MDAKSATPITHTGPVKTSKAGEVLRYPLYPELVQLLIGDEHNEPKVCHNHFEVSVLLTRVFKTYWGGEDHSPLAAVRYEKDWHYNDETMYSDYFRSLRMAEPTGLSIKEFLDLDYALAMDILDKEVKRAEKEIKEEGERRRQREESQARERAREKRAQSKARLGRR